MDCIEVKRFFIRESKTLDEIVENGPAILGETQHRH